MPDFDPAYGYNLEQLLQIVPPPQPEGFSAFWQARYMRAMRLDPRQRINSYGSFHPDYECYDLSYRSTDDFEIGGWVLIPKHSSVTRGVIVGHGYGGREGPDFDLPIPGRACKTGGGS